MSELKTAGDLRIKTIIGIYFDNRPVAKLNYTFLLDL